MTQHLTKIEFEVDGVLVMTVRDINVPVVGDVICFPGKDTSKRPVVAKAYNATVTYRQVVRDTMESERDHELRYILICEKQK